MLKYSILIYFLFLITTRVLTKAASRYRLAGESRLFAIRANSVTKLSTNAIITIHSLKLRVNCYYIQFHKKLYLGVVWDKWYNMTYS